MADYDDAFNFVICPICCEVFQGPVLQCTWGHSFCGECISQWLGKKSTCPQCRKPLNKTSLCRNLIVEQAIEELVTKNHLTLPPIKQHKPIEIGIPVLSLKPETTNDRGLLLKIVGCNVIFLAICFAAVAAFSDEETRTVASKAPEIVMNKEHIPIQIVIEELVYHVGSGISVTCNFLAIKGVFMVKLMIQFSSWFFSKSFIFASFIEEYGILLLRFIGTLMLTIFVGLGRCVWYASQVLLETSQLMSSV